VYQFLQQTSTLTWLMITAYPNLVVAIDKNGESGGLPHVRPNEREQADP
jgi:hypothetical protein